MRRISWWVVANPNKWSWKRLFEDGTVRFYLGNLRHNYSRLQVGDVVVGYEASPRRRLTALATVSKEFGQHGGDDRPYFELSPLALVPSGPTYEQLLGNPIIAASQPMRCRNQGTLFKFTENESHELQKMLGNIDSAND